MDPQREIEPVKGDALLIVSPNHEEIAQWFDRHIDKKWGFQVYSTATAIEGFRLQEKYKPILIVVDDQLPDMNGMSFCAIVKDTPRGKKTTVYVFNVRVFLANTKANFHLPVFEDRDDLRKILMFQVNFFLKSVVINKKYEAEIKKELSRQYSQLPAPINNNNFTTFNIFSPFDQLSGDCFGYWTGENDSCLFGFLFDCTGHGPESYPLVGAIRSGLEKNCHLYQVGLLEDLSEILSDLNDDVFSTSPKPIPTAVIVFRIDHAKGEMKYCTGGIPGFFVKKTGEDQFRRVLARGGLIGMFEDKTYTERTYSLENVEEIIFSSDGFSEIIFHNDRLPKPMAKHDDVSAVIVTLKRRNQNMEG